MELELWSYTFRHCGLVDLARAAAAAGFRWITATPEQIASEAMEPAELRRRVEAQGVGFSAIDGLVTALPGSPHFRSDDKPDLRTCLTLATSVGAGVINLVHVGGGPTPVDALAAAFAQACRMAAEEGVRLTIEFLPGTGIPDIGACAAVVSAAGHPSGSILLDSWHFARGGSTLADLTPDVAAMVGAIQLADRSPEQDREPYVPMRGRKMPGEGALPLGEMVARVLSHHPSLPVGVEVLSDEMDALGPFEGARLLAARCRSVLSDVAG